MAVVCTMRCKQVRSTRMIPLVAPDDIRSSGLASFARRVVTPVCCRDRRQRRVLPGMHGRLTRRERTRSCARRDPCSMVPVGAVGAVASRHGDATRPVRGASTGTGGRRPPVVSRRFRLEANAVGGRHGGGRSAVLDLRAATSGLSPPVAPAGSVKPGGASDWRRGAGRRRGGP